VYHHHTASSVDFEFSAGLQRHQQWSTSVNGLYITDEGSVTTAALIHKVEDLTVQQLYDEWYNKGYQQISKS
jgi:hypothetical protein